MTSDREFMASLESRIEDLQNRLERAHAAGDASLVSHLERDIAWLESQRGG